MMNGCSRWTSTSNFFKQGPKHALTEKSKQRANLAPLIISSFFGGGLMIIKAIVKTIHLRIRHASCSMS